MQKCECAGIGRQARLRGVCLWRMGSSPITRTRIQSANGVTKPFADFLFFRFWVLSVVLNYWLNFNASVNSIAGFYPRFLKHMAVDSQSLKYCLMIPLQCFINNILFISYCAVIFKWSFKHVQLRKNFTSKRYSRFFFSSLHICRCNFSAHN